MVTLTLYSRPGCCLCDEAYEAILPVLSEFGGVVVEVVNIDADPSLQQRFRHEIPVLELGAAVLAVHRVDPSRLREQLRERLATSPPRSA